MRQGVFEPGELWLLARSRTEVALEVGALKPIETVTTEVEEEGIVFNVRIISSLKEKEQIRRALSREGRNEAQPAANPFLPYDEALHVADVSPTHVCLLNKFPVLADHLLIVTRAFRHQDELLDLADFEALRRCMAEGPALGFYNGGEIAGASQPHKHLQLVPLPIAAEAPELPIEPALRSALVGGELNKAPRLGFDHLVTSLPEGMWLDVEDGAARALACYRRALDELDLSDGVKQRDPYNLLVTPRWLMVVPRSGEFSHGLSINSVGFAGGLLVRNQEQLETVKRVGPFAILRDVARGSS